MQRLRRRSVRCGWHDLRDWCPRLLPGSPSIRSWALCCRAHRPRRVPLGILGYSCSLAAERLWLSLPPREQRSERRLSSVRSRDLPLPLQNGVSADLGVQLLCRPSPGPHTAL